MVYRSVQRGFFIAAAFLFMSMAFARHASADSFYINFCPGSASCPSGVSEASLRFDEVLGTSDPNDYTLTMTITGNATTPHYIDEVSFSISGVRTPQDYTLVAITGAPVAGSPWMVYFDNVSASIKSCTKTTQQSQENCTQSDPNGTPPNSWGAISNGTNQWVYNVDLAPGVTPLSTLSNVNLRAQFLNADGTNAGILSPGGGYLTPYTPTSPLEPVPEPGSLFLLGSGLVATTITLRRRLAKRGRRGR